jgi:hypothetical protein
MSITSSEITTWQSLIRRLQPLMPAQPVFLQNHLLSRVSCDEICRWDKDQAS